MDYEPSNSLASANDIQTGRLASSFLPLFLDPSSTSSPGRRRRAPPDPRLPPRDPTLSLPLLPHRVSIQLARSASGAAPPCPLPLLPHGGATAEPAATRRGTPVAQGRENTPRSGEDFGPHGTRPGPRGEEPVCSPPPELLMLDPRSEIYPTIEYRPIQPSDLEALEKIHLALFPIRYLFDRNASYARCSCLYCCLLALTIKEKFTDTGALII